MSVKTKNGIELSSRRCLVMDEGKKEGDKEGEEGEEGEELKNVISKRKE